MKMKSAQEIFNQVSRHLIEQNKKSMMNDPMSGGIMCAYRGDNGLKCAIGVLIKDEHYKIIYENYSVKDSRVTHPLNNSGVDADVHYGLLHDLQNTHDRLKPSQWSDNLREIAKNHKLKPDCLL